ncbi:beta-lactamase class A [Caulobacter ginsengisoli]|uniref:beta-lactamase n=1 Tax=Caulobacter ginsengisoli TaxID=400775 RepID=A0ABU0IWA1_9CAUL|nr:class A beta-lactamase [Caulobacter ginsengisoli]MDQ0466294.1 beta-lactamase class A [Caulobacter ginsengisoli]
MAHLTRRSAAAGLLALTASPALAAPDFAALDGGGTLQVFVLDTGSGRTLSYRADQRALMCSTFKVLAVGAVLARVDRRAESLDRRIAFGQADLLPYSPVTTARVGEGRMTVEDLCAAMIQASDNTAANLVMDSLGGPPAVTAFARSLGDKAFRLDRRETELNLRSGDLDTTTPRAMARSLKSLLLGKSLSAVSRFRLENWMQTSTPGARRLRAGLPKDWVVGTKAGGGPDQTNDLAIVRPPGRKPILIAAYYHEPTNPPRSPEDVLADVGRIVAAWAQ